MTKEDRIKELEQKAQEEIAKVEKEYELRAKLPVEPDRVGLFARQPWVTYHAKTLEDALVFVRAFKGYKDISAREAGCLSIDPIGEHGSYETGKLRWEVPEGVCLKQSGGKGFYSAEIEFWPLDADCKVQVEIEQLEWKLRASISAKYDSSGYPVKADFRDVDILKSYAMERVKYAGGSIDAFDIRYYFSGTENIEEMLRDLKGQEAK